LNHVCHGLAAVATIGGTRRITSGPPGDRTAERRSRAFHRAGKSEEDRSIDDQRQGGHSDRNARRRRTGGRRCQIEGGLSARVEKRLEDLAICLIDVFAFEGLDTTIEKNGIAAGTSTGLFGESGGAITKKKCKADGVMTSRPLRSACRPPP
jgi:hypothetical protein